MDRPSRIFLLFAAASIAALPARGEDAVIGPDGPAPGVRGKLYQVSRRWEVGVAFTTRAAAVPDRTVAPHAGAGLGLDYDTHLAHSRWAWTRSSATRWPLETKAAGPASPRWR